MEMVGQLCVEINMEVLKREEARLKGRIKTAKAKVEPTIDVRNRQL